MQYSIKLTLMEMKSIQELLEDNIKKEKGNGTRNTFSLLKSMALSQNFNAFDTKSKDEEIEKQI